MREIFEKNNGRKGGNQAISDYLKVNLRFWSIVKFGQNLSVNLPEVLCQKLGAKNEIVVRFTSN